MNPRYGYSISNRDRSGSCRFSVNEHMKNSFDKKKAYRATLKNLKQYYNMFLPRWSSPKYPKW